MEDVLYNFMLKVLQNYNRSNEISKQFLQSEFIHNFQGNVEKHVFFYLNIGPYRINYTVD